MIRNSVYAFLFAACTVTAAFAQQPAKLTVQADKPGVNIQPTMWGIFFEDINFSADGGLYAELVKNRSFEFPAPLMGWKQTKLNGANASVLIVNRATAAANARYASINLKTDAGALVLTNEGFRGMGLEKGHGYNFSVLAHAVEGQVKISVNAVNEAGETIGQTTLENIKGDWQTYKAKFNCTKTSTKAKLNVVFEGRGTVEADMISLFPADTWKKRPNGLRADLAQKLADLKPGFMRFPGGCIVEGRELINRYQWKNTIGNVADRQLNLNRWNVEMAAHQTPDYYQSFGLGFFEYFQLCEDIGAAPLPILNCGMACQYNSAEVAAISQLDPYVQDALDLIEFANGGPETKWGALRKSLGHPAPFNLTMIGVGNEQWGEQYQERYKIFAAAINKAYPAIKLVGSAGPNPDGDQFNELSKFLQAEKANLIDEHYYRNPDWFMTNANRYDNYNRKGSKVFAGEYAAHISDKTQKDTHAESHNTWLSALSEAAFMTGLERNADVVQMASYAPLLAHVDAWQWRPDLIWFDNLHSVATPNYYVQQLYAANKGDQVIPVYLNNKTVSGQDSLYSSASVDHARHTLIVKVINTSARAQQVQLNLQTKGTFGKQAQWLQIANANPISFNSIDQPEQIKPQNKTLALTGKTKTVTLDGLSVNVFVLPFK